MQVKRLTAAMTIAVCVSSIAACSANTPPAADESTQPSHESLDRYMSQTLHFEPCEDYATSAADRVAFGDRHFDCARLTVPLDYSKPDGPHAEVPLLRVKARGDKIGSLVVNPGGPGGSGTSLVASLGPVWENTPIGERFDIVGFDPRGVGTSTPSINCFSAEERDANTAPNAYLFSVHTQADAEDIARKCVDGSGGVENLMSVGSNNTFRDMDIMRAALGDEKLNYMGYSYGSELGAMYAKEFPDRVRAIAIDGAVAPDVSEAQFRERQFTAFQSAFDSMAELCASQSDCPLGQDLSRATRRFQDLVQPLLTNPVATADGRTLGWEDAVQAVALTLFASQQWSSIIDAISALTRGDGSALLAMRDATMGRGPDGMYGGSVSIDGNLAIRCADNPRTQQEQQELLEHARAAAPFMDPGTSSGPTVYECAAWPDSVTRDIPWAAKTSAELPPTLVVSVTRDIGTPHEGGIAMADLLGSSLVAVDGAQHGIALYGGNACVDNIVTDYFVDLEVPPAGAKC